MEVAAVAVASLKRGDLNGRSRLTVCEETSSQGSDYVSEDEHIQHLEKSGQMQQVIGSQSMLSQEINRLEHPEESLSVFSQDVGAHSQVSFQSTATADFDSQQLAHQYGLLSQDPAARSSVWTRDSQTMNFDSQGSRSTDRSSHGGFGTLLDAVQMFQSQEEEEERRQAKKRKQQRHLEVEESGKQQAKKSNRRSGVSTRSSSKQTKRICPSSSDGSSSKDTTNKRSKKPNRLLMKSSSNSIPSSMQEEYTAKSTSGPSKGPKSTSTTISTASTKSTTAKDANANYKRKRKDDTEQIKQQKLAHRAADLAHRTINDPELAKRLLLSMALTRENPRSAPETLPGPGHVLPEGFFWAHYPPLEKVLKDNMAEYYELSITKCQSAQQQSFNNTLVELVRAESNRQGWLYAPCFTDKNLRDRIRCYYKTHIQNAKKRLRTMVKNPTKRANARHLCAHLDMIERNVEKNCAIANPSNLDPSTAAVITHQDWGSAFAGTIQDAAQAIVTAGDRAASFEARVAASVAVATKGIHDEMAAKRASRPDTVTSGGPIPASVMSAGVVPIAAAIPAAAALAPDAVPTVDEAKRIQEAVAVEGDPIAAEAAQAALQVANAREKKAAMHDVTPRTVAVDVAQAPKLKKATNETAKCQTTTQTSVRVPAPNSALTTTATPPPTQIPASATAITVASPVPPQVPAAPTVPVPSRVPATAPATVSTTAKGMASAAATATPSESAMNSPPRVAAPALPATATASLPTPEITSPVMFV